VPRPRTPRTGAGAVAERVAVGAGHHDGERHRVALEADAVHRLARHQGGADRELCSAFLALALDGHGLAALRQRRSAGDLDGTAGCHIVGRREGRELHGGKCDIGRGLGGGERRPDSKRGRLAVVALGAVAGEALGGVAGAGEGALGVRAGGVGVAVVLAGGALVDVYTCDGESKAGKGVSAKGMGHQTDDALLFPSPSHRSSRRPLLLALTRAGCAVALKARLASASVGAGGVGTQRVGVALGTTAQDALVIVWRAEEGGGGVGGSQSGQGAGKEGDGFAAIQNRAHPHLSTAAAVPFPHSLLQAPSLKL
jgi:hypothetical protein